jgi:hypothetical protein
MYGKLAQSIDEEENQNSFETPQSSNRTSNRRIDITEFRSGTEPLDRQTQTLILEALLEEIFRRREQLFDREL